MKPNNNIPPPFDHHQNLSFPPSTSYGFAPDPYGQPHPPSSFTQAFQDPNFSSVPQASTSQPLTRTTRRGSSTAPARGKKGTTTNTRRISSLKTADNEAKNFMDLKRDKMTSSERSYSLIVRQDPEKARLCSFKEENETSDRRPIDPPPIVEIQTSESDPTEFLEATSLFVTVTLVAAETPSSDDEADDDAYEPYNPTQLRQQGVKRRRPKEHMPEDYEVVTSPGGGEATTGEVVLTPEKFKDVDGKMSSFCVFSKLSVRLPGVFRLRMTLYEHVGLQIVKMACVLTSEFEVFSPKQFTGMKESTALTRHFAHQGLKIKLRTGGPLAATGKTKKGSPSPAAAKTGGKKDKKKGKWMDETVADAPQIGTDDGMLYPTSYAPYGSPSGPSTSNHPHGTYPNAASYPRAPSTVQGQRSAVDLSVFSLSGLSAFDGPSNAHSWAQHPAPPSPNQPYGQLPDSRYQPQHHLPPLYGRQQQPQPPPQQSYYSTSQPSFSYQNVDPSLADPSVVGTGGGGIRGGPGGSGGENGHEDRDQDGRVQYREPSRNSFYDSSGQSSSAPHNNIQHHSSASDSSHPFSYNPPPQPSHHDFYGSSGSQPSVSYASHVHQSQPRTQHTSNFAGPSPWQTNYYQQQPVYPTYISTHHSTSQPQRPIPPPSAALDPPGSTPYHPYTPHVSVPHPSAAHNRRDVEPGGISNQPNYLSFTQQYLHANSHPQQPEHQPQQQQQHQRYQHQPQHQHHQQQPQQQVQYPSVEGHNPHPSYTTAASLADRPRKSHASLQRENGRLDGFGYSHRVDQFQDDGLQHGSRQYGEFWQGQRDFGGVVAQKTEGNGSSDGDNRDVDGHRTDGLGGEDGNQLGGS